MQDGKISLPYGQFLGYEKGENGLPKIVEAEAKIVRLIYMMFLQGKTINMIARHLTAEGIPTPAGKVKWNVSTVMSILQNEKYKGDAILQKGFTVDFLTKKTKKNEGEIPQYYVKNSHPAIVEPEVFDLVQVEMKKRKSIGQAQNSLNIFSSRIICGECVGFYGSKVWHSNSKYRRTVWRCNNKYKGGDKCQTPHLYETMVRKAFVEAFNQLFGDKERLIENYAEIIEVLTDTTALDKEFADQASERDVVTELMRKDIEEDAHNALDQEDFNARREALLARYNDTKSRMNAITEKIQTRAAKRENISRFMDDLENRDGLLNEFDEALWCETVETVTVYSEKDVAVTFKDGSVVHVDISGKEKREA
jgi:hypothetical protein